MFKNKAYPLLLILSLLFVAIIGIVSYVLVPRVPSINFLSFYSKNNSTWDSTSVSEFKINEEDDVFKVKQVLDGDTIKIDYYGQVESVRLIGLDAPEITGTDNVCYASESKDYLTKAIGNNNIKIESDPSVSDRDRYNRLLRYIYVNGENLNKNLILNGFATEVSYTKEYEFQKEFKQAQLSAFNEKLGV